MNTFRYSEGTHGMGGISIYSPGEKSRKFKELAEKRMLDTLKGFRLIGNLSSKKNYNYTIDEAKQIFDALEEEIHTLKLKFELSNKNLNQDFKLK